MEPAALRPFAKLAATATAACIGLLCAVGADPASAASSGANIHEPVTERAPIGAKGGIHSPFVQCDNLKIEPVVSWSLANVGTGAERNFSWTGAYPDMEFPRVDQGTYASTTMATCGHQVTTSTDRVTVTRKTKRTTISRGEYHRIQYGMTRKKVDHIVGYHGRSSTAYAGTRSVVYEMMPFWRWTIVEFRHGRVIDKVWNVDHD